MRYARANPHYPNQGVNPDPLPASALTAAEVSRLAACCPNLCTCELRVADDVQLSPLAALSDLTGLQCCSPSEATFESLADLTQLEQLRVPGCRGMSPSVLVGLTALQQLQHLRIHGAQEAGADDPFNVNFGHMVGVVPRLRSNFFVELHMWLRFCVFAVRGPKLVRRLARRWPVRAAPAVPMCMVCWLKLHASSAAMPVCV